MWSDQLCDSVWIKGYLGGIQIWTGDLLICSQMLYHWAIPPWIREKSFSPKHFFFRELNLSNKLFLLSFTDVLFFSPVKTAFSLNFTNEKSNCWLVFARAARIAVSRCLKWIWELTLLLTFWLYSWNEWVRFPALIFLLHPWTQPYTFTFYFTCLACFQPALWWDELGASARNKV